MSTPLHRTYQHQLHNAILNHHDDPSFLAELRLHREALLLLWTLDLGPATEVLAPCYAGSSRGNTPWAPVVMLRSLLLSMLVGTPAINAWANRLRSSAVLRFLVGLFDAPTDGKAISPSIGAHYRFMDRIHDGPPLPGEVPGERPSEQLRRRASAPQSPHVSKSQPRKKGGKKQKLRDAEREARLAELREQSVNTMKLVTGLIARRDQASPADRTHRINALLLSCGLAESGRRGLLGDLDALIAAGDGSSLPTSAFGLGKRTCTCPRSAKCLCDRIYADPDARRGYDAYRKSPFFGYFFYEFCAPAGGHDLPLYVRLDPASTSEHERAAHAREGLVKLLRDDATGLRIKAIVQDCGHDSLADHLHIRSFGIRPVIPLRGADEPERVVHPKRPELSLSRNGIPLCQANVEMSPWGSAGKDRPQFACPVKAGRLPRCPLAPETEPNWVCQPETKHGPLVHLNTKDNPRLFPEIHRNSRTYKDLYALRTGCERSNSRKKQAYRLDGCRHRRSSYWHIRIGLAALLQHGAAWVSGEDAQQFLDGLLREASPVAA